MANLRIFVNAVDVDLVPRWTDGQTLQIALKIQATE